MSLYGTARRIAAVFREAGHTVYFAGGCVRDKLLGRPVKDIDIAVSASPGEVERLFQHTAAQGRNFGVITVLADGAAFDVASFRCDGCYADGRRPDGVRPATPQEDAQRRDITINGLFEDPETGEILDYVGGRKDLDRRVIRMIGRADDRIREDKLRMLRVVRFAGVLGFSIEPKTLEAVAKYAPDLGQVSCERIGTEFTRMLCESERPSAALELLADTGLLKEFLPELLTLRGCTQPPEFHPEGDVWVHTLMMLDALSAPRIPELMFAVLLHDIGKPVTRQEEAGRIRFPCHAVHGERIARSVLKRLKCSGERIQAVSEIIRRHMNIADVQDMRESTLRRWFGSPFIDLELELARLDMLCSSGDVSLWSFARERLAGFRSEPVLPPAFIRGGDLIAAGLKPGPDFTRILNDLYDRQLEGAFADKGTAELALKALMASPNT